MAKVKSKKAKREEKKKKYQYSTTEQVMEKRDAGFKPTSFQVPAGMEVLRFDKAGNYDLDIIPFVTGKHNPIADEGIVHWDSRHEVHDGIGIDTRKKYVCPMKRGMGNCPVCEHQAKLRRKGADKDRLKPFNTKKRVLYCVKNVGEDGEDKLMLFEASYFGQGQGFGEMIDNKLEAVLHKPKHPYHRFWHLENGRTVSVTTKKSKWPGGVFYKATNIEFIERENQYDESILEEVPCLDDLIDAMVLPYDKLKAIFEQEPEADEEEGKKKSKKKVKKEEEDEEEEDLEADEEEEDLEEDEDSDEDDSGDDDSDSEDDDDEEVDSDESEDSDDEEEPDDEEEDEEEEDEKPKSKKKVKKTKKKKVEEEDDDEDDSSDDGDEEEDDEDSEDVDGDGDEDADDDDEGDGDDDDDSDEDSEDDEEEDEDSEEVDEGDEDDDIPFSDEDEDEEEEEKPKKKVKKKKK